MAVEGALSLAGATAANVDKTGDAAGDGPTALCTRYRKEYASPGVSPSSTVADEEVAGLTARSANELSEGEAPAAH